MTASTPDFDAAIERATNAIKTEFGEKIGGHTSIRRIFEDCARAALRASGWEDASMLLQEFANQPAGFTLASLRGSARAWVAQYTPEGK